MAMHHGRYGSMRQKVSDYIADFLVENGIDTVFTVVGGGSMHLNDSFGHHPGLHCVYNHHEQASAMAAAGYALQGITTIEEVKRITYSDDN